MADIPNPRSYPQTLGEAIDVFLGRYGAKGLRPGGPILSLLEAAAQSDVRATQDLFNFLVAIDLNSATGLALDRIGASENLPRRAAVASRGLVTILDTTFEKISSKVFQGQAAPIAGSTTIYIADATDFPATGSVYLGRGTSNLEGPIAYSAKTTLGGGAYYSLTLSSPTQKYHNVGESVILAQGGDRLITSGSVVQTPQGNAQDAVSFVLNDNATILDGEVEVDSVAVVCQQTGTIGNIPADSITSVPSPAFTGQGVTNDLPFTNGQDREDDQTYRERIKSARQTRTKGTKLAIQQGIINLTAADESSRIISASVVSFPDLPTTVYIDDGTGYEPKSSGIATESIIDLAAGGEQYFQLQNHPVARATLESILTAPFALEAGSVLAILVGGVRNEHIFVEDDFIDIQNATAHEIAASINGDPTIDFGARTSESGTKVVVYCKVDTNDDLELTTPSDPDEQDANDFIGLPAGRVETVKLYLRDQLLYKDGLSARLTTNPQTDWHGFDNSETLIIDVDGTGSVTYEITNQDFLDAETGYTNVSEANSLDSWVAVLNAKIPGITAALSGTNAITLTSNLGANDRASLEIDGDSTLVNKGMFEIGSLTSQGAGSDYILDRNLGQIKLTEPLAEDDFLSAGSENTRAYIETEIDSVTLASTGNLWFVVDGAAEIVTTGIMSDADTTLTLAVSSTSPTKTLTATLPGPVATYPFTNVEIGDWIIIWDPAFSGGAASYLGTWRISNVDTFGQWVEFDSPPAGSTTSYALTGFVEGGVQIVRTAAVPQKISFSAATYEPQDVVTTINNSLKGGVAETIQTTNVRVRTNRYDQDGDIALVAADTNGQLLGFDTGLVQNSSPHMAEVESGNSQLGTPCFNWSDVDTYPASRTITLTTDLDDIGGSVQDRLLWVRTLPSTNFGTRFGSQVGDSSSIESWSDSSGEVKLRTLLNTPTVSSGAYPNQINGDRIVPCRPFGLGPSDSLHVLLDDDAATKNFNIPLYRNLIPNASVGYSTTVRLKDADNSNASLATAFGTSFDFTDMALYMHARCVPEREFASPAANREVLYRFADYGPQGNYVAFRYGKPTAPATAATIDIGSDTLYYINLILPSGARKGALLIGASEKFGTQTIANSATSRKRFYFCGFEAASFSRTSNVTTVTVTLPTGVTANQYVSGQTVYITNPPAGFTSGSKVLTAASATTISYAEVAADQGATAGSASYVSWTSSVAQFSPTISVGDYVNISSSTSLSAADQGSYRVVERGAMYFAVHTDVTASVTTAAFQPVNSADAIKFFPVDQNPAGTGSTPPTVTELAAVVNTSPNTRYLTATVLGTGAGTITQSTSDDYYQGLVDATYCQMADGVNWISTSTYNGGALNYDLVLKMPVETNLATSPNDWANETIRMVPLTIDNLVDFLSVGSVTGLTLGGGSIKASNRGGRLQITSATAGSGGSVEVQGGTGNSAQATMQGSPVEAYNLLFTTFKTSESSGFFGDQWVSLDNSIKLPKLLTAAAPTGMGWTSSTTLTMAADGEITVGTAGTAWNFAGSMTTPVVAGDWRIEKHGNMVAYISANYDEDAPGADFSTVEEGDYVLVQAANGAFSGIDSLNNAFTKVGSITLLSDGRMIRIGGPAGNETVVEEYDPDTNVWTDLSSDDPLPTDSQNHTATLLEDDTIVVIGGTNGGTPDNTVYIFDPNAAATTKWTTLTDLSVPRSHHTATLLADGTILVAGGQNAALATVDTAEIYDPTGSGSTTLLPDLMTTARKEHVAVRLPNNQVLLIGGRSGSTVLNSAEIYSGGIFTATSSPGGARYLHQATLLSDETVLVTGGSATTGGVGLATTAIYDFATDTWTAGTSLNAARNDHSAIAIDGGDRVLVVGGRTGATIRKSAEIYDIENEEWVYTGGIQIKRHSGVALASGEDVYLFGGTDSSSLTSCVRWSPDLGIDAANAGTFRVVRVLYSGGTRKYGFWIENENAVEELTSIAVSTFYNKHSILPGDSFVVGASTLGADNQGIWTVSSINPRDTSKFFVSDTPTAAGPTALGSAYTLFQCLPAEESRLIKQIRIIAPDESSEDYQTVIFTTQGGSELIGSAGGTVMNALDKLAFTTDTAKGIDGYKYHTGLIAEANRVIYGDDGDPATYPGIAAAQAAINIEGPTVKRVQVSIAIRTKSTAADVIARVQTLVAAVINGTGVGESIAISDIVEAANKADGVTAVTILSPTYGPGNDQIDVQPFEKPMVLNLDQDVQVSVVGT
jgi:uncharacterized phage protein gp47/JayE